ncbi:MAG: S-methyl-5-thioribose-1-phosphate isomerase [Steroidobacteraceae bacterium]
MKIGERHWRTIWSDDEGRSFNVIDQTKLPFELAVCRIETLDDAACAIRDMVVRGAPLIGATAAYGLALASYTDASDGAMAAAFEKLLATRPTAINLRWALERMRERILSARLQARPAIAGLEARRIADEDVECCRAIGVHSAALLAELSAHKAGAAVNVLTHCNAGWLACVDWGTALAGVYAAFDRGINVHVYVDETRPRNQGASLTAYELGAHGVAHTLIADNAAGHLLQRGEVDICIVGSDRTSANGDVANKIGTYNKALAAKDNGVPFYAALPSSTIDWAIGDGIAGIPIEERSAREVTHVRGRGAQGELVEVQVAAPGTRAFNPAFDVTPARLVSGIITERGIASASAAGLRQLYPERGA